MRSTIRPPHPAREALVRLLAGEIVEIAIIREDVGRIIHRHVELLAHLLHGPKRAGDEDGVLADAFPERRGASDAAARAFDNDRVTFPQIGPLSRRRVNLHEPNAIELLAR